MPLPFRRETTKGLTQKSSGCFLEAALWKTTFHFVNCVVTDVGHYKYPKQFRLVVGTPISCPIDSGRRRVATIDGGNALFRAEYVFDLHRGVVKIQHTSIGEKYYYIKSSMTVQVFEIMRITEHEWVIKRYPTNINGWRFDGLKDVLFAFLGDGCSVDDFIAYMALTAQD